MNTYRGRALPLLVFALSVLGLLLIPSFSNTAHAQCGVTICKSAPQLPENSDVAFVFTIEGPVGGTDRNAFANGPCSGVGFSGQVNVVENVPSGWILEDVDCTNSELIEVTPIDNGVSLNCLGGTETTCTFTNRRVPAIPTLSEWGMISAAAGLALVGVFFAVRRRKALNS